MRWNRVVTEYSTLHLTCSSDRLPALAGIARQYGTKHGSVLGHYVAGLWEHSLVHDLVWYVHTAATPARPEGDSIPSWSWASASGEIERLAYSRTMAADLEVTSFHIDLAGPDEFGPVSHAELTVRGFLATGSWSTARWPSTGGLHAQYRPDAGSGTAEYYQMHADYEFADTMYHQQLEEGSTLFCLKMGFVGDGCHVCLILKPLDEERRAFARIGLLLTAPKEDVEAWYEDGQTAETFRLL